MVTINPLNGQIRTKKRLGEYSGVYQFTITVMDNGPAANGTNDNDAGQSNLSGTCVVQILVKEYNMHAPKFVYPNANNSIIRIKSVSPSQEIKRRVLSDTG